jgi:hypothetical protein
LLYLEANLHGLLVGGPWEVAAERRRWRTSLEQACSVSAVKTALLQVLSRQPLFLFEINICIGQGTEGAPDPSGHRQNFLHAYSTPFNSQSFFVLSRRAAFELSLCATNSEVALLSVVNSCLQLHFGCSWRPVCDSLLYQQNG